MFYHAHGGKLKEEFLFCEDLQTMTRGTDIMDKLNEYFGQHGLEWGHLCGVCTNEASAMLRLHSGFVTFVKEKVPDAICIHCMIHQRT